jgi:uncharacterized protein
MVLKRGNAVGRSAGTRRMVIHPGKAIRALAVAESFSPSAERSTLAGVVMRADLVVDGVVLGAATVGGSDATRSVLRMYRRLEREDVNLILLSGCVISRYNIIDVDEVARRSGLPVLCLTYNESRGIVGAIRRHFREPEERIRQYRKLGGRTSVELHTGRSVYVRCSSIGTAEAKIVLDAFTLQGVVPEPVRLAKLFARAASLFVRETNRT